MIFYCPNCRKEVDCEPTETITTKNNRTAYKSLCPTCGQDMAEFLAEDNDAVQVDASVSS